MGDETTNWMNLDLNLGPVPDADSAPLEGLEDDGSVNLEEWIDSVNLLRERLRARQLRWQSVWRQAPVPSEARNIALELMINPNVDGGRSLLSGEASGTPDERDPNVSKMTDNNETVSENQVLGEKGNEKKDNEDKGSFFDCNICFDLARDPVVTCCGHLYCWPCLYQWLHLHSDANECPVCKGEVTMKKVTPIYGRGNSSRDMDGHPGIEIPDRPHARRIEGLRQAIWRNSSFSFSREEMSRHFGSDESALGLPQWFLSSRVMRRNRSTSDEDAVHRSARSALGLADRFMDTFLHNHPLETNQEQPPPSDNRDPASSIATVSPSDGQTADTGIEIDSNAALSTSSLRRIRLPNSRRFMRRDQNTFNDLAAYRGATSRLSVGEMLSLRFSYRMERNQEQAPPSEDRDSMSSVAAVIHSGSQNVDTAVDIDSNVSISTSSSRRRNNSDASRVSDVDSGDSRAHRRRRLN